MVFKKGGGGRGRVINIYCYMIEDKSFRFPNETLFRVEIIYMSELFSREYYLDVFFFRKERKCSSFFVGSGKETGFSALKKRTLFGCGYELAASNVAVAKTAYFRTGKPAKTGLR